MILNYVENVDKVLVNDKSIPNFVINIRFSEHIFWIVLFFLKMEKYANFLNVIFMLFTVQLHMAAH